MNKYQQLVSLNIKVQRLIEEEIDWEMKYDLIFSKDISRKVFDLFEELNLKLDYYDPDSSYEEDIKAFAYALDDKMKELSKVEYVFE